jgi:hypothetical protein
MTEYLQHVTLSGHINGNFLIKKTYPDGSLLIVPVNTPHTTPTHSGRDATHEEFAAFEAAYGPFLAPDGEG